MTPMLCEHFHGAVTRGEPTATAVPHREPGWNLLDPVGVEPTRPTPSANIAWTKETHAALKPELVGVGAGSTTSATTRAEDAIRRRLAGANYDRLREVKRRYDPENVFHAACGSRDSAPLAQRASEPAISAAISATSVGVRPTRTPLRLERLGLRRGGARRAGDDRAGVAHRLAGRAR